MLLGIARVAQLRQEINQILNPFARAGECDFVVLIGDPHVEPRVLWQFDAALECVERDGSEAEAVSGRFEEVVAVRILDEVLAS